MKPGHTESHDQLTFDATTSEYYWTAPDGTTQRAPDYATARVTILTPHIQKLIGSILHDMDWDASQDAIQEGLIRVWKTLTSNAEREMNDNFLMQCAVWGAKRHAMNYFRSRVLLSPCNEAYPLYENDYMENTVEDEVFLEQCLAEAHRRELPEETIFTLKALAQGWQSIEIGRAIGCSHTTVRTKHRAALRPVLETVLGI